MAITDDDGGAGRRKKQNENSQTSGKSTSVYVFFDKMTFFASIASPVLALAHHMLYYGAQVKRSPYLPTLVILEFIVFLFYISRAAAILG